MVTDGADGPSRDGEKEAEPSASAGDLPAALTISAIVITRGRVELLARTLPTVLEQDLPAGTFEVIVVDDGSTDGTSQLLNQQADRPDLQVLRQAPRGISAARNAAIEAARGRFVVFLDDDLLCEPGLLRAHAAAHALNAEPLIVVGRLGVSPESTSRLVAAWLAAVAASAHARRSRGATLRDAFVAANCSAPLELLRSWGGFDESFVAAREEHELGLRLVRAGARPFYEPRAVALEVVEKPVEQLLKDARAVGRDEVSLCRRYTEYRPHSTLARLADGPWWKHNIRKLTTRSRLIETIALEAPARLAARLDTSAGRKAGVVLTGARHGVALRRGAVSAAGSWDSLAGEFGRRLPVLSFHRVGPPVQGANPELTVTPRKFRAQLGLLRRLDYTPIRTSAWLAWCRSAEPVPRRPVLLTFDDAYADLHEHAFPALASKGYGATLFAPSELLGKENHWDEALQAGSYTVSHRLLDTTAVVAWHRQGVEVGAHSRTHARLPTLSSRDLVEEVDGSKRDLERLLGAPVTTFAYPFGAADERVRDATASVFDTAFTIDEGLNTLATDPLMLRRSVVQPSDTALDLLFRLWLGWSPLHRLKRRLARRRSR
jgi:glycosyltransferase involved in cell wall biosynthesis/peptidoglycan/xylan/chitin deacetylase (PgdA/CDA1 family)